MPVYLQGLSLKNFRGIGPIAQDMVPFKEFNFFIGANNAGKSTVLDFISRFIPLKFNESPYGWKPPDFKPTDRYFLEFGRSSVSFPMEISHLKAEFLKNIEINKDISLMKTDYIFLDSILLALSENGYVWFNMPIGAQPNTEFRLKIKPDELFKTLPNEDSWRRIRRKASRLTGGNIISDCIPDLLNIIRQSYDVDQTRTYFIPAKREIGPTGGVFEGFSGQGLIDRLAEIQSPDHDKRHEKQLFDKINDFLRTVINRGDARIEIPHNRQHVLVHIDDKVLPLSSLGTGIHEVIMIAAFCTLTHEKIVCIEEPEQHLHPLLQKRLMKYLKENTKNQYFIATHSPSFIDTDDAAIFHVRYDLELKQTTIHSAELRSDKLSICHDLGHKASDLLQTNAIIWVEGPSDRIYLNHWITALAPNFIEGTHYSIMFYGGRLLRHLSANDIEVNEFIDLRALNQNIAIVIDSDKRNPNTPINETKRRLVSELGKKPGVAWVTNGREIENYIEHTALQEAVKSVHSGIYDTPLAGGKFDHALHFRRAIKPKSGTLEESNVDKVKVARKVCELPANLDVLDLRVQVGKIVDMIRAANEI